MVGDVDPSHHRAAPIDGKQCRQHAQGRRLTSAVGSQEAEDLPPPHLDADAPDRLDRAGLGTEALAKLGRGDDGVQVAVSLMTWCQWFAFATASSTGGAGHTGSPGRSCTWRHHSIPSSEPDAISAASLPT